MDRPATALAIDDDRGVVSLYAAVFQRVGLPMRSAPSVARAREELRLWSPCVVILDVRLPDGSGLELVPALEAAGNPPVIFATASAVEREIGLVERFAFRVLSKPFDICLLQIAIEAAWARSAQAFVQSAGTQEAVLKA